MELSTAREATTCAASILRNPKFRYIVQKNSPTLPILSQTYPVDNTHSTPKRSILMLSIHLHLGLPSDLFPSGFLTSNLYTFLFSPFVPHVLPTSSSSFKSKYVVLNEMCRFLGWYINIIIVILASIHFQSFQLKDKFGDCSLSLSSGGT
jgi:hypothetical protein